MADVPYRQAIGKLLYMAVHCRPDISTAIGILSRQCANPQRHHWTAIQRVLRYLKGTSQYGIVLTPSSKLVLTASSDSSWGSEYGRKSISGYVLHLGGALVSYASRKQNAVALSSTEAEYMAMSETSVQTVYLRKQCKSLHCEQSGPTEIQVDNSGTVCWVSDGPGSHHTRTRHVDIRYHYTRDLVIEKVIALRQVPSNSIQADCMTKPTPIYKFKRDRYDHLGMTSGARPQKTHAER